MTKVVDTVVKEKQFAEFRSRIVLAALQERDLFSDYYRNQIAEKVFIFEANELRDTAEFDYLANFYLQKEKEMPENVKKYFNFF